MPKRNRRRNKVADYLAYLGLRTLAMIMHAFRPETNYVTARILGDAMYRFDRRHLRRAEEHLRRSFPDWPAQKRRAVARASIRNLVYLAVEFLFTSHLITPGRWRRHITLVNQKENLRLLLKNETGMVFLTGHFGNWEVVGYVMAALGFPNTAVARRLDNPYLDAYVIGRRELRGMTILDKRGATEVAPRLLDAKGAVSFIADQDAGKKGLFVDFFGRPASTYKAIGLLAMQHNAPVVVGFGRRQKEKYHFEIGIQRIIHPAEWVGKDDPLRYITQEYTKALEDVIRTAPEQYLWVHRRWKHRPKGEEPAKDGIA
ncbi:MAG: lysophospholipid acyltransferase family protein [Phycisphaerae bacterium]|nr:lysophospholipid acyltransferase family protein [Phycisphaerae bacterium]